VKLQQKQQEGIAEAQGGRRGAVSSVLLPVVPYQLKVTARRSICSGGIAALRAKLMV
jgi:hypothetical protein